MKGRGLPEGLAACATEVRACPQQHRRSGLHPNCFVRLQQTAALQLCAYLHTHDVDLTMYCEGLVVSHLANRHEHASQLPR